MSNPQTSDGWSQQHDQAVPRHDAHVRTRLDATPEEAEYLRRRGKEPTRLPLQEGHPRIDVPIPTPQKPVSPTEALRAELSKRDFAAIGYARSRLTEGDTLVVVKYPTQKPVCDATGFVLDTVFRVNSWKLLATGSTVFAKMLSKDSQEKARRRPLFRNMHIPQDVVYVLDLTPATDDEDALELVTSLSCPKGILYWSTATSRLGISQRFVGGYDEQVSPPQEPPQTAPFSYSVPAPTVVDDFNAAFGEGRFQERIKIATERSLKDTGSATPVEFPISSPTSTKPLPADYCGIRHCAGIERMLQLIEGKEARLDSAPKVWTVAMLAGFFDCTSAVVDAICTWVVSQQNGIIIEILPEVCLRLGLVLRSQLITRAAFAVLVSEEAICIAGQIDDVPLKRGPRTPLARLREDIDDDALNMIQHAARSFYDRIDNKVKELLNAKMSWLTTLPEYQKLSAFELVSTQASGSEEKGVEDTTMDTISELRDTLIHYVRGSLFHCLLRQINFNQVESINGHRTLEQYILPNVETNGKKLYDDLMVQQRVLTRPFWELVGLLKWTTSSHPTNLLHQPLEPANPHSKNKINIEVAKALDIKPVHMYQIHFACEKFNVAVFEQNTKDAPLTIVKPRFTLANIAGPAGWEHMTVAEKNDRIVSFANAFQERDHGPEPTRTQVMAWEYARLTRGHSMRSDSPFFELSKFLEQVGDYLSTLCNGMTDRGENIWFSLPETLVCLSDAEYKYLPLFAGGFEDGTGGVYQDELPPAVGGPNGPGPSYHTGFSIASAAGSTVDSDSFSKTESTIGGWSRDVDNGKPDHIDRRRVADGSEVSFGSKAFEDLGVKSEFSFSEMDVDEAIGYVDKGKGKEVDRGPVPATLATTAQPSSTDFLMSDDGYEFDSNGDDDEEFDFMDDSDDTATERGDNDGEL